MGASHFGKSLRIGQNQRETREASLNHMTPEEAEQVQAHIRAIAAILYKNTPASELTNLETLEKSVRRQVLEHVSPNIALFLPLQVTGVQRGKTRQLKSCVGMLKLKTGQTLRLGVNPRTRLSPLLEKCCLRLSANESYQSAEAEIEALTGVKVSHSTQQRRVVQQQLPDPVAKQSVGEVSVDGGKVRRRGNPGEGSHWRDLHCCALRESVFGVLFSKITSP